MTPPFDPPELDFFGRPKKPRKPFDGLRLPPGFDPLDPYALKRPQREVADGAAVGQPAPAPFVMKDATNQQGGQPLKSDFRRKLEEMGTAVDAAMTGEYKGTPAGLLYSFTKGTGEAIGHDAAVLGKAALRPAGLAEPLAPGEPSEALGAGLNLTIGVFWPMGKGTNYAAQAVEQTIMRRLMKPGGATLTNEGKHFMGSGYLVADPALTSLNLKNADEIALFLRRPDVAKAIRQGKHVGKWTDPKTGYTEINISDALTDRSEALMLAQRRGEQAMGHIERGEYVGSIDNPAAHPTNSARVIGRDAAGYELLDNGTKIRPSAPPIPKSPRWHHSEKTISRDRHGVETTDRGLTIIPGQPNPRGRPAVPKQMKPMEPGAPLPGPDQPHPSMRGGQEPGFSHGSPPAALGRVVVDKLIKEDAISRVKALKAEKQNVEMQRQPDGTWSIIRKGEPQAQNLPVKANPVKELETKAAELQARYDRFMQDEYSPHVNNDAGVEIDDAWYERKRDITNRRDEMLSEADGVTEALRTAKWEMKRDPNAIGPKGGPIGDGEFQSRLMTTLEYRHQDAKALTPEEWYKRLSNDKNVPKAELDAIFSRRKTPESEARLAEMQKRYNELVEWRNQAENQPPNVQPYGRSAEDSAAWALWHEKKDEINNLSDEMRVLQRSKQDWDDYLDSNGKLTREEMQRLVTDESPVSALERKVLATEEGAQREMDHDDIQQEMDHIIEQKTTEIKEELTDKVSNARQEREAALKDARVALAQVVGDDAADDFMDNLISNHSLDDDLMSIDNDTLSELREGWSEDIWDEVNKFNPGDREPAKLADPLQVPMFGQAPPVPTKDELRYQELLQERDRVYYRHEKAGQGDNPPLHGEEYNEVMTRIRTVDEELLDLEDRLVKQQPEGQRKFMPRQWAEFRKTMQRAESADREGAEAALDHDTFDPDEYFGGRERDRIERTAIENLEETGEYGGGGDRETQFHDYQRVDENAPYREILIHQKGAGVQGGHFNDSENLVAHARGEIHGDTYLMIEAQSDFAQRLSGAAPKHVPFAETERWAQLSTGGSMIQAAQEKKRYFAWVSPENRMDRANLAEEAAEITYGHAVPKAVERIFRWLDMPFEPKKFMGSEAMRVELTPEMRKRILSAGIPALGLVGAAALQTKTRGE